MLTASSSSPGTVQLFLTALVAHLDGKQLAFGRHHCSPSNSVEIQLAAVHRAARLLVSIGFGFGEKYNNMVEGVLSQGKVFSIGTLRTLICVQSGWPASVKVEKGKWKC